MKLSIFYGKIKPATAVGEHQCRLLQFAFDNRGWHSYAKDRTTKRAIQGLIRRGSIKLNQFDQFQFNS